MYRNLRVTVSLNEKVYYAKIVTIITLELLLFGILLKRY